MTRAFAIILLCTCVVMLPNWFPHELSRDLPRLPDIHAGCQADLTVGWLDCFHVFDNGTWIRTRSY